MKLNFLLYFLFIFFSFTGCTSIKTSTSNVSNNSVNIVDKNVSILKNDNLNAMEEISIDKIEEIQRSLTDIIGNYKDNISIYYYNFTSKNQYTLNENIYHVTASLKKVPLAMQVLDKVYAGEITLNTEISYEHSDYADGTGILQFEETIGSRSIEELLMLSLTESDNIAYNMLNRLCEYTLIDYVNSLIGENSMIVDDNNFSRLTAKHNFEILYNLYTNHNNNPYYELIINYLKDTAFNDSINKYLPKGSVAHKIGSYYRSYHDEAIVFGKEDYILVILTKDIGKLNNDPELEEDSEERNLVDWGKESFELMAKISKTIYDIVNN